MILRATVFSLCLVLTPFASADAFSDVAINGQVLTRQQLALLEMQLGGPIAPGNYLVNGMNGCWLHLESGASGCPNAAVDSHSRYGSGSRDAQGNWNHYSEAAGGAVGGTADGCVYTTFGWSNC